MQISEREHKIINKYARVSALIVNLSNFFGQKADPEQQKLYDLYGARQAIEILNLQKYERLVIAGDKTRTSQELNKIISPYSSLCGELLKEAYIYRRKQF